MVANAIEIVLAVIEGKGTNSAHLPCSALQ